jgi:hypothetical protein
MGWTRYLLHDYYTAKELDRIDERMRSMRSSSARSAGDARERVEELEDDLGRLTLLVHALAEACVRKGVLSRDEIAAVADDIDLLDGCADGKLAPSSLRDPDSRRESRPQSPEEHLRQLEKRDPQSPGEFLSNLED